MAIPDWPESERPREKLLKNGAANLSDAELLAIFLRTGMAGKSPREVVKRALHHNAAAMIFAHNHPSGLAEPSRADEMLTQSLKQALALVDVNVLDHFIVGGGTAMSFAERGLI